MLHLIRIIMFVVYEQLPQSLLSTHFQKLFCLICISSSSILFPRSFFSLLFCLFPCGSKISHSFSLPTLFLFRPFTEGFLFSPLLLCLLRYANLSLSCPALFQTALQAEAVRLKLCKPTPPNTRATRCPTRNYTIQPIANKDTFTLYCEHQQHTMTCMWTPNLWQNGLCIHLVNYICDYITCFDFRLHLSTCPEPDVEHQIASTGKATNLLKSCNELLNLCVSNSRARNKQSCPTMSLFIYMCFIFNQNYCNL